MMERYEKSPAFWLGILNKAQSIPTYEGEIKNPLMVELHNEKTAGNSSRITDRRSGAGDGT